MLKNTLSRENITKLLESNDIIIEMRDRERTFPYNEILLEKKEDEYYLHFCEVIEPEHLHDANNYYIIFKVKSKNIDDIINLFYYIKNTEDKEVIEVFIKEKKKEKKKSFLKNFSFKSFKN